jgi:hypothetical protein
MEANLFYRIKAQYTHPRATQTSPYSKARFEHAQHNRMIIGYHFRVHVEGLEPEQVSQRWHGTMKRTIRGKFEKVTGIPSA